MYADDFREGFAARVFAVAAIDAKPPICYRSNRSRGEISRILISLSPSGIHRGEAELAKQVARVVCGEDCVNAGWSLTSADAPNGIRHRAEVNFHNSGLT